MEKILCIDDEISVLDGVRRQLRRQFDVVMATSGEEGLKCLDRQGPFHVIICDMRMPGMDGIHFFSIAKERTPDSVRILFTGNADLPMAIHAVNEGNIFRFLTKPCSPEALVKAVEAGISQYRLITAEQLLLQNTLKASVQVLVDILGITHPVAFSRAMRLRFYTAQIAQAFQLPDLWQFEVAAMLSQIGCVAIPCETLEKLYAGETLSTIEQQMVASYPSLGSQLIARIPQVEVIAEMIARQQESPAAVKIDAVQPTDRVGIGAQIIKTVLEFDILISRGFSASQAIGRLADQPTRYHAAITKILPSIHILSTEKSSQLVNVSSLQNGVILAENIRTMRGMLVVSKDQEVNDMIRERLKNLALQGLIADSVRVTAILQKVASENK